MRRILWLESTGRFLLLDCGTTSQYNTARDDATGHVSLFCCGTDAHAVTIHYAVVRGGSGTSGSRAILRGHWINHNLRSFRQFVPAKIVRRLGDLWIVLPRSDRCIQYGHCLSKKGKRFKFLNYLLHVTTFYFCLNNSRHHGHRHDYFNLQFNTRWSQVCFILAV